MNQDVKYDFTADLTGTGDRSVYEICETLFYIVLYCCYTDTDKDVFTLASVKAR